MRTINLKYYLFLPLAYSLLVACPNSTPTEVDMNPIKRFYKNILLDKNIGEYYTKSFSDTSTYLIRSSYLGEIVSNDKTYKILTAIHYTGILQDAIRARGEVRIYNAQNLIIGMYDLGGEDQVLSTKVENNMIAFYPYDTCTEKTEIDFSVSFPERIFIRCKKEFGDLYSYKKVE